jgi:hypothetical protein
MDFLVKRTIPTDIAFKKRLFSKGSLSIYSGEGVKKFASLSVRGLNFYHYDFGIAYPVEDIVYPLFLYQVIIAPDRVLALVHFPFNAPDRAMEFDGMEQVFALESEFSELFLTSYKPQAFLKDEVIANEFNGLIRTTSVDEAYDAISQILSAWHQGLKLNSDKRLEEAELQAFQAWIKHFGLKFYKEDYGFRATQRYLGKDWALKVFGDYLFDTKI